jgi:predicted nucleic acid-binding protein
VVVKWYLRDENLLAQADAMLDAVWNDSVLTTAPNLARHEVSRAITVAIRTGRITWEEGQADIESFLRSPVPLSTDDDWVILDAASRAVQTGVALYDAVYLSLAANLSLQYVTADRKLFDRISSHYPFVHWLGDI